MRPVKSAQGRTDPTGRLRSRAASAHGTSRQIPRRRTQRHHFGTARATADSSDPLLDDSLTDLLHAMRTRMGMDTYQSPAWQKASTRSGR
jgi:hypothetical protein